MAAAYNMPTTTPTAARAPPAIWPMAAAAPVPWAPDPLAVDEPPKPSYLDLLVPEAAAPVPVAEGADVVLGAVSAALLRDERALLDKQKS